MQATGTWQRQSLFLSLSHLQSVVIAVPTASLKHKTNIHLNKWEEVEEGRDQTTLSINIWILFQYYKTQFLLFQYRDWLRYCILAWGISQQDH